MATRTPARSGSGSKSAPKTAGRSGSARKAPAKKAPAKKTTAKKTAARKTAAKSAPARTAPARGAAWDRHRAEAADQLRGHGPDAAAIVLLVVGALTALGLFGDAAGGIGRGLASVTGALFGVGRYAVPVVCLGLAILLFFWRPGHDEVPAAASEADAPPVAPYVPAAPWRVGVGLGCCALAGLGIAYLATGAPPLSAPVDTLRDSAGYLGALIGAPLVAVAGTVGSAVIFGGLALLGVLMAPGVPMRRVLAGIGRAGRWAGGRARAFADVHPDDPFEPFDDDPGFATPPEGFRDPALAMVADPAPAPAVGVGVGVDPTRDPEIDALAGGPPVPTAPPVAPAAPALDASGWAAEADAEPDDPTFDPHATVTDLPPFDPDATLVDVPAVSLYDAESDGIAMVDAVADDPGLLDEPDEPAPAPRAVDVPVIDAGPGRQAALDLGHANWRLPDPKILKRGDRSGPPKAGIDEGGQTLQAALLQHGVDATLVGTTVGPTVTRYELELAPGVKVNRVTALSNDIAYAMASPDVRILAPIPGRSAIGVEVPNRQRQLVTLGDILTSPEAKSADHPLEIGLGRDIAGRPVMLNLATLPHALIAGSTGAGKSSCINSLVTSLAIRNTPEQVRLILVDPKRVELGAYNDLPHLLTPVVTNPKKAANALDWAVREMDMRYETLAEAGFRDITGYNAAVDRGDLPTPDEPDPVTGRGYERLPFIVIVIDELNDLMMVAARDVEASVCRIAQMARAVGIHLVIATQRPSVDVITGVIKANVPSRLAFSVTSLQDSRVILDQAGAEKLVGKGDLLMVTASSSRAQRIQCAWVDEDCVRKVVAHWKRQSTETRYVEGIADDAPGGSGPGGDPEDDDELLGEAMSLVVRSGMGSTSMLQRKLRVGFSRAGRLMDLLERRGVVGPSEGSKARAVLMTVEELEAMEARGAIEVPEVD